MTKVEATFPNSDRSYAYEVDGPVEVGDELLVEVTEFKRVRVVRIGSSYSGPVKKARVAPTVQRQW